MNEVMEKTEALIRKPINQPDEVRTFLDDKGRLSVFGVGGCTLGRGEFQPGWRWSMHVKPMAGTDSCKAAHTGIILSGKMCVHMDNGEEVTYQEGDAFYMPPGHDAWVVGDQPCMLIDFTGAEHYAVKH
ncbi:Cupin domain protein [Noviherbaspirillum humi]|uniref:Cupin domain protein n=1 Tax=Noviherbaspirillum humi TaxID=1688639 RepID=A0A239GMT5_9BURK|nr:cupin domain-containing protein [Noviherbaspirillum humi]SNS70487.1 Cupin domain protein [Noviherbaspirillum humi]